jgi:outer membrane protein
MKLMIIFIAVLMFTGNVLAQEKLGLNDCISIALKNNSTLKQKEYSNQAAQKDVLSSYSGILPTIDLSFRKGETTVGSSERTLNDVVVDVDPLTGRPIYGTARIKTDKQYVKDNSLNLSVNQNIIDGGRWWNRINKAAVDEESSDYDLAAEMNAVILSVQSSYFDLLKQIKLYEVNKVAVQRSEGQLKLTQKMFELGSKAKLDVFQAKVNLGNDKISLLSQRNVMEAARRNLNLALGREPDHALEIQSVVENPEKLQSINALIDDALENQPALKRNEANIKSFEHGVSLAEAQYYPSLSAYFQYNRRNSELEKIYKKLNLEYVWSVGISLNWNLFNGMTDYVNVQKAKINKMNSQEIQVAYLRSLKSRIKGYYDDYISYVEITHINEENLEAAKEELRLAKERYTIGAGTSLDVREAQVKLTRAEETLIAARYNTLITLAQLDNELGITEKKLKN